MRELCVRGRMLFVTIVWVVLACGLMPRGLQAQTQTGTGAVAGVVLDPDGKPVANAPVSIRNDAKQVIRTLATDINGRFGADGLPDGDYAIEVSAANFTIARRTGVQVGAGKTADVTFTLALAGLNEQLTVSGVVSEAASAAPSQGSLTARSAQSEISATFIDNYTSPIADYTQVMQMAPGTFSYSPNGQGLGDTKLYF